MLTSPEYETGTMRRSIGASYPVDIVQHEIDVLLILGLYISTAQFKLCRDSPFHSWQYRLGRLEFRATYERIYPFRSSMTRSFLRMGL